MRGDGLPAPPSKKKAVSRHSNVQFRQEATKGNLNPVKFVPSVS